MVPFFPHFIKLDFFSHRKQDVLDVALSATNCYFLTRDRESGTKKLYSIGCGQFGQLGDGSTLTKCVPVDISSMFDSEVVDVAAGGFHALALTSTGKVYGWGKRSKCQLGSRYRAGEAKAQTRPIPIRLEGVNATKVHCGSLYSMAQVAGGASDRID